MIDYQIRIRGRLDESWSDWFDGWQIRQEANGDTVLVGPVCDEAELYGMLAKIRQIGLKLISINPLDAHSTSESEKPED